MMLRVAATFLVMVALLLQLNADALCPANGSPFSVYITVNGEENVPSSVFAYDTNGRYLGTVFKNSSLPHGVILQKLRGMKLGPKGELWVASSRGKDSQIAIFSSKINHDCTRDYSRVFVKRDRVHNPLMKHPYDFVIDEHDGIVYVSNQNSGVVSRYHLSNGQPVAPLPGVRQVPGAFLSEQNDLGYHLVSCRGMALAGKYLLVADVAHSEVHVFHTSTGKVEWEYDHRIISPIQLVMAPKTLDGHQPHHFYATTKANGVGVYKAELTPNGAVVPLVQGNFEATSGIAPFGSHQMLVADRLADKLYIYRDDGLLLGMLTGRRTQLPDHPEFVAVVKVVDMNAAPWCHEHDNIGYKVTALCLGIAFWILLGIVVVTFAVIRQMIIWFRWRVMRARRSRLRD